MAKQRKLQSICAVDLDELVRSSNVRNEVIHIQISNINGQEMLLEQIEHDLNSKLIEEFKNTIIC